MKELLKRFELEGDIVSVEPYGNGHINKTFLVKTLQKSYIFQFVNASVFPDVAGLMNNIALVTKHLQSRGVPTLHVVPTKDGQTYVNVGEDFFRGYDFIENSVCYEKLPNLDMVRKAAEGFGQFHSGLSDIDVSKIVDVIPDFHNTRKRYEAFCSIVLANPVGRLSECKEEVDFLVSRQKDYSMLVEALDKGDIRASVTHNDPKINNVAFDKKTGEVACVLDLDTVMGGTFLYDFGDGLRSLFTGDNEDSTDLEKLVVDLDIYEAYLDGYFSMMKDSINDKEIELLPYSILVIAEELSLRFLGDFLNGDAYFHVDYPTHNLVRARTQIALAKDILKHMDELQALTKRIVSKYGR